MKNQLIIERDFEKNFSDILVENKFKECLVVTSDGNERRGYLDSFIELIEKGKVRYDNRLGIYRTGTKKGSPHNHGGGFRISPKAIHELYNNCIALN